MNQSWRSVVSIALLILFASLVRAQDQKGAKQEDKSPKAALSSAPLAVPVSGLTKENWGGAKTALLGLSRSVYKCPACGAQKKQEGTCTACNKKLEMTKGADRLLRDVEADLEKGVLSIRIADRQVLHSSDLQRALRGTGVRIARDKLPIDLATRLVVDGATSKSDASELEKTLTTSRIFGAVAVSVDSDAKRSQVLVTKRGPKAATFGTVSAAILKTSNKFSLSDVAWTAPCTACKKKGMKQGACPACWKDRR